MKITGFPIVVKITGYQKLWKLLQINLKLVQSSIDLRIRTDRRDSSCSVLELTNTGYKNWEVTAGQLEACLK